MKKPTAMTKFAIIVTVLSLIFHVQGVHGECERLRVSGAKYQKSTDGVYEAMYNYYCSGRPVYQQSNQVQGQNYLYYYEEEYKFSGWQIGIAPCANEPVIAVQDASHSPDRVKLAWHEFRDPFWIENRRISVECLDFTLSNWTVAGIALGVVVIISIVLSAAWRMCHQFRAAQRRSRRSRRSAHSRSTNDDGSSSISLGPATTTPYRNRLATTMFLNLAILQRYMAISNLLVMIRYKVKRIYSILKCPEVYPL